MHHNEDKARVAVIGAGHWGKNLVRNFADLGALAAVCDPDPQACAAVSRGIETCSNFSDLLRNPSINSVAIATPAISHYPIAKNFCWPAKMCLWKNPWPWNRLKGKN